MQIFMVSLIAGYMAAEFHKLYPSKYTYLLLLPLCTPFVLTSNLNPIRQSLYAEFTLFFFLSVIFKYLGILRSAQYDIKLKDMILWGILGAVISTWRSEGVVFMLGVPVLLGVLFYKKLNLKKVIVFFLVFAGLSAGVERLQSTNTYKDYYKIYNYMSALNSMNPEVKEKIRNLPIINKFYEPSADGIEVKIAERILFSKQDIKQLDHTLAQIVMYNFPALVKNRFTEWTSNNIPVSFVPDFEYYRPLRGMSEPFNKNLRIKTMEFLFQHDSEDCGVRLDAYNLYYNMYIPACFLLIFFIAGIIRKKPLFSIIPLLLGLYALLVVLFAHEHLLNYLYVFYLCSCVFTTMFAIAVCHSVQPKYLLNICLKRLEQFVNVVQRA